MKIQRYYIVAVLVFLVCSSVFANVEDDQITILRSDAALFDKAAACRELALIGTERSVDTLSALLCDETLGDYARLAMESIDDPSVDRAFRKALDECKGKTLAGVVNSIGVRRDAKAVSKLSKLALDPASGVSAQAIAALGRIATSKAIETNLHVMKTGSETLRSVAANACLASAEHLLDLNKRPHAIDLYVAVGKANVPKHLHAAAVYGEIIARRSDGLPLLIKHLRNDDLAMVEIALRAGRELPGSEVSRELANQLPKLSPKLQVLLIKAIVDRKDSGVLKSIQALAVSDSPEVRAESLKVLGRIGDVSSAQVLLKASASDDSEAQIAHRSLRILNSDGVDEAIIQYMKKTSSDAKADLIDVLADRNAVIAVDPVLAATKDKDAKVQRAAFKALGSLASPEYLSRVVSLVGSLNNEASRKDAERAVVYIVAKIPDKSMRAGTVIKVLEREKNIETRCSFIRILGGIAGDKAFEAISASLQDENERIRDTSVRAIAAWQDTQALDTLLAIFENSSNRTHRVLALRSYIRLIGKDKQTDAVKKTEIYGQLIKQVNDAAEKKSILGGLASLPHPSALTIVTKYLTDPQVKDEAMLATIQVARSIAGSQPDQAKQAVSKIQEMSPSQPIRNQTNAILKTIESFGDFITGWQVSGPYFKDGQNYSKLLNTPFAPETGGENVIWSVMPAGTDQGKPWLLDLLRLYPGNSRAAYVYTWVHSSAERDARVELGSDDGVKVWLNGQVVHVNNIGRAAVPGSDKFDVKLRKGWNKLMLKVTQDVGPWGYCVRLRSVDSSKLEGITVDCFYQPPLTSLLDRRTFTGWEGDLDWFSIGDGAVVAGKMDESIPHNFFLATTKEYYNFELRLKVKTSNPNVNGGIQFRSKRIENHHEVKGYQADVGPGIWGTLYDESRRNKALAPANAEAQRTIKSNNWNDYRIRCFGERIQLYVNGIKTVDYIEADASIAKQAGIIAVQIHSGPPSQVSYKDIQIKEL